MTETVTEPGARGDLRPPSLNADERTTLSVFLGYLREAVIAKALGVSEADSREPAVASGTSLLGLIKHLAAVEYNWFVWSYDGIDAPRRDDEAAVAEDEGVDALVAEYREAIRLADLVLSRCSDLSRPGARSLRETAPPSMRWILIHMIEETARHAGHADIIRERIDGAIGR